MVQSAPPFILDQFVLGQFVLYQRDDCHLCDLALAVLSEARLPGFESVFIDDDAALEHLYGARVPVLRDDARGIELDWPFDAVAVAGLLGSSDQSQSLQE
jgi:hypothetical protein